MTVIKRESRILRSAVLLAVLLAWFPSNAVNILMDDYDLSRSGANTTETVLTPANVNTNTFGLLFTLKLDGPVYAQPLYLENLAIADGVHNVVFVCTEANTVNAFDADTGDTLWSTNLGRASTTSCYVYANTVGITGTPVIDPDSGTLYVDTRMHSNLHLLHALDITTGAEKFGGPAVIAAPGFDYTVQNQRPGLVLYQGVVYISYSSFCDSGDYHGFVLGYNATNLTLVSEFNDTPSGSQGGIWASGMAPAVDDNGNFYLATGNGSFDGVNNYGSSYVKLNSALQVEDFGTPTNWASLNEQDLDVSSGGAILLPPHYVVGMAKDSTIYLMDQNNLGQVGGFLQVIPTGSHGDTQGRSPVCWQGPANQYLYFAHGNNPTLAYTFNGTNIVTPPFGRGAIVQNNNCGAISLSANGNTNGILWEVGSDNNLRAYDAVNFPKVLWSGKLGKYIKMNPPIVANGKVYAATASTLTVWGLEDNGKPVLTITSPKAGSSVSNNAAIDITGTVKQITPVTNVVYSVNGGDWNNASSDDYWTNWTAGAELIPGTNTISACAIDNFGNSSPTITNKVIFVQSTTLTVATNGSGSISPNYNGKPLAIGEDYSMTAKAGRGFTFTNWTDGDQDPLTTNSKLTFEMASNLTFIANFNDTTKPTVKVTSPANNSKTAGPAITISGTAADNVGVASVFCQVNNDGWQRADSANGFTNWTIADQPILTGANIVQTYSTDGAGNVSTTNMVKFTGLAP